MSAHLLRFSLLLVTLGAVSGCTNRYAIRPDQLQQLDGFDADFPAEARTIEARRGATVRYSRGDELTLTLSDGSKRSGRFEHIEVGATRFAGTLADGGVIAVDPAFIRAARVTSISPGKTAALVSGLAVGVGVVVAIIVAIANAPPAPPINFSLSGAGFASQ
jgi:hypothetical protein